MSNEERIIDVEGNEVNEEVKEETVEKKGFFTKVKDVAKKIDKKKAAKTVAIIGIGVVGACLLSKGKKAHQDQLELTEGTEEPEIIDVESEDVEVTVDESNEEC